MGRGIFEEVKVARSRLRCHRDVWVWVVAEALSGFMALMHSQSVLMSMVPDISKD